MTETNDPRLTDDEQTAPLTEETEPETEPGEETDLVLTPEEAEEEVEVPQEDRVFGMPRMCFHGAALGIALGYILTGLIGMVLHKMGIDKMPSATVVAIVCAGLGYLVTKRIYDKRKKEAEAAEQNEQL